MKRPKLLHARSPLLAHLQSGDPVAGPPPAECATVHPSALPGCMVQRLASSLQLDPSRTASAPKLLRVTLLSMSVSIGEKDGIVARLPSLSDDQVSELTSLLGQEASAFTAVAGDDFPDIARRQAQALHDTFVLMEQRCSASEALRQAWLRRTLRQCPPQGAFRRGLEQLDEAWWQEHAVARWAYRGLFGPDHPSWAD